MYVYIHIPYTYNGKGLKQYTVVLIGHSATCHSSSKHFSPNLIPTHYGAPMSCKYRAICRLY